MTKIGSRVIKAVTQEDIPKLEKYIKEGWRPAGLLNGENPLTYSVSLEVVKFLVRDQVFFHITVGLRGSCGIREWCR